MKYSRRHVSLREDVYEKLEERARRRGFPSVASYISHLAALDDILHGAGSRPLLGIDDYARAAAAARAPLDPDELLDELRAAMRSGWAGNCWDAVQAFRSCARRRGRRGQRLCQVAVDLAAEKIMRILMVEAPFRCAGAPGYTLVLDVDRGRQRATVCVKCHPA